VYDWAHLHINTVITKTINNIKKIVNAENFIINIQYVTKIYRSLLCNKKLI
jgi:hypothetical protein